MKIDLKKIEILEASNEERFAFQPGCISTVPLPPPFITMDKAKQTAIISMTNNSKLDNTGIFELN